MEQNSEKQLLALDVKFHRAPARVVPFFDQSTRKFIIGGISYKAVQQRDDHNGEVWYESVLGPGEDETDEVVASNQSYVLQHGALFRGRMGDLIIQMGIDQGMIVRKQSDWTGNPFCRFYLRDDLAEAKQTNRKAEKVREALNAIASLQGNADRADLAWAMGKPVKTMTLEMVDSALNSAALDTPEVLLDTVNGRDFKIIAFMEKLRGYGVLVRKGEQWWYGDELLGADRSSAVQYLKDGRNATIREALVSKLHQLSGGTLGGDPETKGKKANKSESKD